MLPTTMLSWIEFISRGVLAALSQARASRRSSSRNRFHSSSVTELIRQLSVQSASVHGRFSTAAPRLISDMTYRKSSTCASIDAQPAQDFDAALAESLSSDVSRPACPLLSIYALVSGAPSISSE